MLISVACSNSLESYNDGSNLRKGCIPMLKDNIKILRKTKGLSQEDLAIKLNRQSANSTRS